LLFHRGPGAYVNAIRFYHRCSELAYKKHHFEMLQESKSEELTHSLRQEIRRLAAVIG
jgi:hypothetical protein